MLIVLQVGELIGRKDQDLAGLLENRLKGKRNVVSKDSSLGPSFPANTRRAELNSLRPKPRTLKAVLGQSFRLQSCPDQPSVCRKDVSRPAKEAHQPTAKRHKTDISVDKGEESLDNPLRQDAKDRPIAPQTNTKLPPIQTIGAKNLHRYHDLSGSLADRPVLLAGSMRLSVRIGESSANNPRKRPLEAGSCYKTDKQIRAEAIAPSIKSSGDTNPEFLPKIVSKGEKSTNRLRSALTKRSKLVHDSLVQTGCSLAPNFKDRSFSASETLVLSAQPEHCAVPTETPPSRMPSAREVPKSPSKSSSSLPRLTPASSLPSSFSRIGSGSNAMALMGINAEHGSGAWTREAFDLFGWRLGDAKGMEQEHRGSRC